MFFGETTSPLLQALLQYYFLPPSCVDCLGLGFPKPVDLVSSNSKHLDKLVCVEINQRLLIFPKQVCGLKVPFGNQVHDYHMMTTDSEGQ